MGVGIFPGDAVIIHGLVALITFVTSSLSTITAYRLDKGPFLLRSGRGGEERFVAYPVVLLIIGFGGYLMGAFSKNAGQ